MDEVKEGCKYVKGVGEIPEDWEVKKLNKCVDIIIGLVNPIEEPYCNMIHIGLGNIEKLTGRLLEIYTAKEEKLTSGKYLFNEEHVLYGKIRPELGKVVFPQFEGICSADIYPLKANKNIIIPLYLKYILLDYRFYKYSVSISMRTGMPKINRNEISNYKVILPPLSQQKKISQILSTWDEAIDKTKKLIEDKKLQKKGLMQQLLTGKKRLKEFQGEEWEEVKLGDVLKFKKKEPITNPEKYYLLTVKLHLKGIEATNNKPNITKKGRPYYLREPNELLIGRQNFHNGGMGIVPNEMVGYIASNAISSLEAKKGNLKFYYYYLSNSNFYKRIGHIIGGTGQKEISESMMKKLKVTLPSVKEQQAIANILTTADKEINLLEEKLEVLKEQKKGLMQQLLTGKVRVKV